MNWNYNFLGNFTVLLTFRSHKLNLMARLVLLLDKAALWLLMMIYLVRLLLLIQLI